MTDNNKEVIREVHTVRTDTGFENVVFGILIAAIIGVLIWAFATGRINLNQGPATSETNRTSDVNVDVNLPNVPTGASSDNDNGTTDQGPGDTVQ